MSALAGRLKQLWTKAKEYADALEGADASLDDYVFALGKRVDEFERRLEKMELQAQARDIERASLARVSK